MVNVKVVCLGFEPTEEFRRFILSILPFKCAAKLVWSWKVEICADLRRCHVAVLAVEDVETKVRRYVFRLCPNRRLLPDNQAQSSTNSSEWESTTTYSSLVENALFSQMTNETMAILVSLVLQGRSVRKHTTHVIIDYAVVCKYA